MSAMSTLNYTPNFLGRNLRMSSSKKILVLLPSLSNQFYSRVVLGIEDIAIAHNYNVMVCSTHGEEEIEENYFKLLFTRLVDGVILFSTRLSETRLNEIASSYPVVQCCEYKRGVNTSRVIINNEQAAYDAVCHIIACGHKRIGLIAAGTFHLTSTDRTGGYKRALADSSITVLDEYITHAGYSSHEAMYACEGLMRLPNPPTAIFCISDGMAVGAIRQLHNMGLKVCEDVAVVGFDNTSIAKYYTPTITTIAQPRYEMGTTAMEMLLKKLQNVNSPTEFVMLPHQLIVRQSTVKDAN